MGQIIKELNKKYWLEVSSKNKNLIVLIYKDKNTEMKLNTYDFKNPNMYKQSLKDMIEDVKFMTGVNLGKVSKPKRPQMPNEFTDEELIKYNKKLKTYHRNLDRYEEQLKVYNETINMISTYIP